MVDFGFGQVKEKGGKEQGCRCAGLWKAAVGWMPARFWQRLRSSFHSDSDSDQWSMLTTTLVDASQILETWALYLEGEDS